MQPALKRQGKRWTDDERSVAAEMLRAGHSYDEVGQVLGRTALAVEKWAEVQHLAPRTKGAFAGETRWAPAERNQLARYWEAGVSVWRIAKILERSEASVRRMAAVMDLGEHPAIKAREDADQPKGDAAHAEVDADEALLVIPRETYQVIRDAARREGVAMARWLIMVARHWE